MGVFSQSAHPPRAWMEMEGGASPTFHGGPAESCAEDIPLYVKPNPAQAPDAPRTISASPPFPTLNTCLGENESRQELLAKLRKRLNFSLVEAWVPAENDPTTFIYGEQYCDSIEPASEMAQFVTRSRQHIVREGIGMPGACISSREVVVVHALDTCDFFARRSEAQQLGFVGAISVPVFSDDGRDVVAVAVFFASVSLKVASNMGWERLTDFLQREWRGSPSPSLASKQAEPEPPCRSPTQAIEQVRRSLSECDLALSNDLMELLWKVGQEQAASGDPQGCLVANTFRDWCARQPDAQLEHWLNVHMGVVEVVRRLPGNPGGLPASPEATKMIRRASGAWSEEEGRVSR